MLFQETDCLVLILIALGLSWRLEFFCVIFVCIPTTKESFAFPSSVSVASRVPEAGKRGNALQP